jgi:hypothetical protein
VNWLEIYDALDRVKEQSHQVIRPAPRALVDAYRRTRTWLREIHARLRNDSTDRYGIRQLDLLTRKLDQDLKQHVAS